MKLDEFTEALNEALILRGVPERIATSNVEKLTAHLNSDSFRVMDAYSSKEELNQMADELSERLLRHLQAKGDNSSNARQNTDAGQKLESLNDAVNRAVGFTENRSDRAGGAYGTGGADGTSGAYGAGGADGADGAGGSDGMGGAYDTRGTNDDTYPTVDAYDRDAGSADVPDLNDALGTVVGDIELTASPEISGIIFDEDDDVIELSASPNRSDSPSGDTVFTAPAESDSTGAFTPYPDGPSVPYPEGPSVPYFAGKSDSYPDASAAYPTGVSSESTVSFSLPADDIGEYAPDDAMFTSMGLADSTYEAEVIETRGQKGSATPELPPLPEVYESAEGKRKFTTTVICLSPFIAVAALAYFVVWGLVFAAEAALIAALIVSLVAVAAAGTLAAITGIIYGIVKLSTRNGEGIFEIGLGIVIAGATLLAGVLIYNAALRFMPWAIKKTAYLCRLCSRCIHIRIRQARGRFSEK